MNKILRVILVLVALAIGVWLWTVLFPNPKQVIRSRINRVAQLASSSGSEGNISSIASVERFSHYFSEDVQIIVNIPGFDPAAFTSRDDLTKALLAAKRLNIAVQAEFLDMNIEMGTGNQSALVDLTLKAKVSGQNDMIFQELKFTMKKVNGDWLITRIETIRTLKP